MTDSFTRKHKKSFIDKVIIKRFGEAEDISNAILFIASDLGNYITGQY
jgi:3-oxoacyl-[acyl-carrier protein] reductase